MDLASIPSKRVLFSKVEEKRGKRGIIIKRSELGRTTLTLLLKLALYKIFLFLFYYTTLPLIKKKCKKWCSFKQIEFGRRELSALEAFAFALLDPMAWFEFGSTLLQFKMSIV